MLKGASKQTKWPSLKTWKIILLHIKKKYPEALFLITGVLEAHGGIHNSNSQLKNKIDTFITSIPGAINCYDIGLENQLSIIQNSNVFIAPHTGFAFLAPCLGTPWLALSGGEWAEEMPAHMPFYSVLPDCNKYPCNGGDMKLNCRALHAPNSSEPVVQRPARGQARCHEHYSVGAGRCDREARGADSERHVPCRVALSAEHHDRESAIPRSRKPHTGS